MIQPESYNAVFSALGEILEAEGESIGIVIVGGMALNMIGVLKRPTTDVDILAFGDPLGSNPPSTIRPPQPMPPVLENAIKRVSRDFGLSEDWLNTKVGAQWETSLPPGIESRINWHKYGGLHLGVASRYDLILFKLYAAADSSETSVHYQDLVQLSPSDQELRDSEHWITRYEDPSEGMKNSIRQVIKKIKQDAH